MKLNLMKLHSAHTHTHTLYTVIHPLHILHIVLLCKAKEADTQAEQSCCTQRGDEGRMGEDGGGGWGGFVPLSLSHRRVLHLLRLPGCMEVSRQGRVAMLE